MKNVSENVFREIEGTWELTPRLDRMTFNRRKNAEAAKILFAPKEKIPMTHVSEAY